VNRHPHGQLRSQLCNEHERRSTKEVEYMKDCTEMNSNQSQDLRGWKGYHSSESEPRIAPKKTPRFLDFLK
jgi:hypothetical protein